VADVLFGWMAAVALSMLMMGRDEEGDSETARTEVAVYSALLYSYVSASILCALLCVSVVLVLGEQRPRSLVHSILLMRWSPCFSSFNLPILHSFSLFNTARPRSKTARSDSSVTTHSLHIHTHTSTVHFPLSSFYFHPPARSEPPFHSTSTHPTPTATPNHRLLA